MARLRDSGVRRRRSGRDSGSRGGRGHRRGSLRDHPRTVAAVRSRGFSLLELLMAMAVATTSAGVPLSLVVAGQSIARAQPEAADVQQRARVAAHVLATELARAGAGVDAGPWAGTLARHFLP